MIQHEDWDSGEEAQEQAYVLPEHIESISVSHDGGRLEIQINSQKVFYSCEGTRDCTITLDRRDTPVRDEAPATETETTVNTRRFYAPDPFTSYANGRQGQIQVVPASDLAALAAENEALLAGLRGRHALTGATYAHLITERNAFRDRVAELEKALEAAQR